MAKTKKANGPADPHFPSDEELYRKYLVDHWAGGHFIGPGLAFPNASFNRSKYSRAKDVLGDDDMSIQGWGVLACFVEDLPS